VIAEFTDKGHMMRMGCFLVPYIERSLHCNPSSVEQGSGEILYSLGCHGAHYRREQELATDSRSVDP
jgi:hypothetical protein